MPSRHFYDLVLYNRFAAFRKGAWAGNGDLFKRHDLPASVDRTWVSSTLLLCHDLKDGLGWGWLLLIE